MVPQPPPPPQTTVDVAIVGAGASGLYAALRLRTSSTTPPPSVLVLEASPRTHGRVYSVNLDNHAVELGAMRFLSSHHRVLALHRNVLHDPPNTVPPHDDDPKLFYLRGHRASSDAHLTSAYAVPAPYQHKTADEIVAIIAERVLTAAGASLDRWRVAPEDEAFNWIYSLPGPLNGTRMVDLSASSVLHDVAGPAVVAFLRDALVYDSTVEYPFLEFLTLVLEEFSDGTSYLSVRGGFERLLDAVEHKAVEAGVHVLTNSTVVSARRMRVDGGDMTREADLREDDVFELDVMKTQCRPTAKDPCVDCFSTSETTQAVRVTDHDNDGDANGDVTEPVTSVVARSVILALPQRPLHQLDLSRALSRASHAQFTRLLHQVKMVPAVKVVLRYRTQWWRDVLGGARRAKVTTDLPIREAMFEGDSDGDGGTVLAAFADGATASFWGDMLGADVSSHAKHRVVDEAVRQMCEAMGVVGVAREAASAPNGAAVQNWDGEINPAAYHAWRPGVYPQEAARVAVQPDSAARVFVAGAAFSTQQGWVEGALRQADWVLRVGFGVRPLVDDPAIGHEKEAV